MKIFWGKKSGKYELSQDIYVLTINIGEFPLLQCTLNSESTIFDCLSYVKQKLLLKQADLFGLRYQVKASDPDVKVYQFIEPTKPMKKQLDKFSAKPRTVHLSILFFTPNVYALYDYTARSLYYTLLKLDVLNGKLTFDVEKYIYLAALSLQVDYGNYEPTVHTLDLLRSLQLLPLQMTRSIQFFDDFLLRILTAYERHYGKEPGIALIEYIFDVVQHENYGEELFDCKDDESIDVKVGYRREHVIVKKDFKPTQFYKFEEIREIACQKRNFFIKCHDGSSTHFTCTDNATSKHVVSVLNLQMKFLKNDYKIHQSIPHNIKNLQFAVPNPANMNNVITKINIVENHSTHTSNSFDLGTTGSISSQCPVPFTGSTSHLHRTISNQFMTSSLTTSQVFTQTSSIKKPQPQLQQQLPPSISTPSIPHQLLSPGQSLPSPVVHPFNARDVEHQILRQLLSEKKARKVGSSPEINMISSSLSNSRYTSNNVVNKAPLGGVGKRLNGKFHAPESLTLSHSTPDLLMQYPSTPSLIQMNNFSKGKVISSSAARHVGQAIVYPVPLPRAGAGPGPGFRGLPPPLENLQTILAGVKPPVDSPDSYKSITEINHSPSVSASTFNYRYTPDRPRLSISDKSSSLTPDSSEMSSSRHVLVNGVVLNGYPDFLKPSSSSTTTSDYNDSCSYSYSSNGHPKNGTAKISTTASAKNDETRINDDVLKHLLAKTSRPETLQIEFASIPLKRMSAGTSTSLLKENMLRNHPKSVLPYEDTRIMLHPTKKNKDGYINASNIQVPVNDRLFRYILTQNPMQNTVEDFYQMLWETNSRVVVSLFDGHSPQIKGESTVAYFPAKIGDKLTLTDFSVRQQSSTTTKGLTTTILSVKYMHTGEKRTVYVLNYTAFKKDGYGVPVSVDSFLGFIDSVNSVKRHVENEKSRDNDSGIFLSNNSSNTVSRRKLRSKSITRSALMDVTNRIRSHSVEQGSRLRKKLSNHVSTSSSTSENSMSSSHSSTYSASGCDKQTSVVIHCLDGSSLSGLYVLVELILHCIENSVNIEPAKLLRLLRQQRAALIHSYHQYIFVYNSVLAYLQRSRLI